MAIYIKIAYTAIIFGIVLYYYLPSFFEIYQWALLALLVAFLPIGVELTRPSPTQSTTTQQPEAQQSTTQQSNA